MKRLCVIVGASLFSLLIGFAVAPRLTAPRSSGPTSGDTANWVSSAVTIADQVAEADLVVRAEVINVPEARKLKRVVPLSEGGKVIGQGVDIMPFTDSEMLVLEVYKGSADKHIIVMQTGGVLPPQDGDPAINIVIQDDPLFADGDEYILFLKDISSDAIHGQGRKLYRIINPASRYIIQGTEVFSLYEFPESVTSPKTLDELVNQIKLALAQR